MPEYYLTLTGSFNADDWDAAVMEAERLRLTVSITRDQPHTVAFTGDLVDGRSRPPGVPIPEGHIRL